MTRLILRSYLNSWRDAFTLEDPVCLFIARVCLIIEHVLAVMLIVVGYAFIKLMEVAR